MHPDQLDGELLLAPGFTSPPNMDYLSYHSYITSNLPPESPVLYGLHPNAEIGFLTATSEKLFKTVFELQPRESSTQGGGPATTREDKIKTLVDDIMEKLPEPFNMIEIMGKVEERTPYVVVAFQVRGNFETFKIDSQKNFQINCCEKSSFSFFVFIRNVKE